MRAMVIDGFSIVSRAFFGTPLLSSSIGVFTNAVHGFASMLMRLEQDYPVDYLVVAFDRPEPTFRHQRYSEYKGTRQHMPEELYSQFDLVRELLAAWQIPIVEMPGYEADDILGTLSQRFAAQEIETLLVTGDRDAYQLVGSRVKVLYAHRSGVTNLEVIDDAKIAEVYEGLTPTQLIDVKALMGDASDNIPGVPKVGEKTALQLVRQFGSLEEVLAHAEAAKTKAARENLVTFADQARLSYELAKIIREVPLHVELDELRRQEWDLPRLIAFCRQYNLRQLLSRLLEVASVSTANAPVAGVAETENLSGAPMALFESAVATVATPSLQNGVYLEPEELLRRLEHESPLALTWQAEGAPWRVAEAIFALALGEELLWTRCNRSTMAALGKKLGSKVFRTWRVKELGHLVQVPLPQVEDLALMAYLHDPGREPKLDDLVERLLPPGTVPQAAPEVQHLVWLQAAAEPLQQQLREQHLEQLYREVELPLSDVLRTMEFEGIRVDAAVLKALGNEFQSEMERLREQIYASVGESFNLNSPKQLGVILFDKLGLPGGKKTKSGYSTDAETLEGLRDKHEAIELLLRYRTLAKLVGTYVEGLIPLIDADSRLRTTFHQMVTSTGRLSSSDPNLQNIPIRQPEGRLLRRAFLPRQEGWKLISADYSQIELRILAHLSKDERFIDAYHQHQDIHRRTAAEVFGVPLDQVTSAQRSQAKAVNFGVVYGISDYGLATQLGISRGQAREFIERFFERYPGIRDYQKALVEEARQQGYVTTIFQRRRYLPEIHSRNYALRSYAERTALNTPIQGSAADLIKIAMLRFSEELRTMNGESHLLLQVHDDLLCEAPEVEIEPVKALLRQTMENAITLSVPLEVEIGVAENWYEVKE